MPEKGNLTIAVVIDVVVFCDDSLSNDWWYGYLYGYEQNQHFSASDFHQTKHFYIPEWFGGIKPHLK